MNKQHDPLATLHEIRNIMDRSSRFISLSGLSGVAAGLSALLGAALVRWHFLEEDIQYRETLGRELTSESIVFVLSIAAGVFLLAVSSAIYFTARNAKRKSHQVWDSKSERMLVNLAIPLAAGGIFCAALFYHELPYLVAPVMLLFYGCALLNASKYTVSDIRYLGILEILLGLFASFYLGFGLLAWTLGFGVLHIVYGALVYFKYER
ncbi:hypothetical protein P872_13060 [Rhodonellum psychrophilum GCM71 = DSM 17998]|uniref:Uncharacterized protein n=2 Tax=Rhodonellum TaxID=336827 RepID=U5BRI4_9BACT|nr:MULTISPECIES: hypothetical protein [Rhodonellum]ERM80508.1 hypothetical protein P872_13060 [Rhodonellum psychrophilum GCM71 = DSM 17998]SDZ24363.1 hypothetical protein SAMN05444412_10885 [Rhodonellum ikkaensis]